MPDFIRQRRIAHVTVEGGPFDGLELTLSLSVQTGEFIDFQKNRWGMGADIETQAAAVEWFAENVLMGWNHVEDDEAHTPTPATYAGLLTLDPALVLEIMRRWREAVTDIDTPLDPPSTVGTKSKAPSTRRAPSSRSQRRQVKQK